MIYYYIDVLTPHTIQETELLDEVIMLCYEGKAKFLSATQQKELGLGDDYNDNLRIIFSSYEERIPLYDIYSDHIYLIHKDNVYPRILNDNYRIIDKHKIGDKVLMYYQHARFL